MTRPAKFTCFFVAEQPSTAESHPEGKPPKRMTTAGIKELPTDQLPTLADDADSVTIAVRYSALNYKDALAASGHPGVALELPLVPGIDAVGEVLECKSGRFSTGQTVMVSGADFGTKSWGGWSTIARTPADYCFAIPEGMSDREAVILGTAGFTAAQSVEKLQHHGVRPQDGPVVVTGATGGVGIFSVRLLAKLGYQTIAVTGKADRVAWLKQNGATEVMSREEMDDQSGRPILSAKFAGGIDTVGGNPLSTLLRSTVRGGCVTACGLVAGHNLQMTVYPFILRGVALQGIDSANASVKHREQLWNRLASDWKLEDLDGMSTEVALNDVQSSVDAILSGQVAGRHIVVVSS